MTTCSKYGRFLWLCICTQFDDSRSSCLFAVGLHNRTFRKELTHKNETRIFFFLNHIINIINECILLAYTPFRRNDLNTHFYRLTLTDFQLCPRFCYTRIYSTQQMLTVSERRLILTCFRINTTNVHIRGVSRVCVWPVESHRLSEKYHDSS